MADENNNKDIAEIRDIEIRKRLAELENDIGKRKYAASIACVSEDMLRRYIKGTSRIALDPVGRMCDEANVSLDWLWSGKGEKQRHDYGETSPSVVPQVNEQSLPYMTDVMVKASMGYRPPAALTTLILELVSVYQMKPEAATRIIQVMAQIEEHLREGGEK